MVLELEFEQKGTGIQSILSLIACTLNELIHYFHLRMNVPEGTHSGVSGQPKRATLGYRHSEVWLCPRRHRAW